MQFNLNNTEQSNSLSFMFKVREVQAKFEDESRAKALAQDNLVAAERKSNANKNALEEARTLLEQTDRSRRTLEQVLYQLIKIVFLCLH